MFNFMIEKAEPVEKYKNLHEPSSSYFVCI